MPDALFLVVSRRDVESGDLSEILGSLQHLVGSTEIATTYRERVDLTFEGYDNDTRELWEIPEFREFVSRLDEQFPTGCSSWTRGCLVCKHWRAVFFPSI